jgi:predicted DNA-binding ribbon-helix-helix protein
MTGVHENLPPSEIRDRAPVSKTDPTRLVKRSVVVAGHRTSVSLEDAFWAELRRVATARHTSINGLIAAIDESRSGNLSSAIRVFLLLNRVQEN